MDNFDLRKYLAEGPLNERQFFDDKQLGLGANMNTFW